MTPKPIVNNKITYPNIYGRIIQFDEWLNQGVRNDDSPTFNNLQLTGDATIEGDLFVQGNMTILDTEVVEFADNIFLINRNETGSGVTLNLAGIEIERGTATNYQIVFRESDDTVRIGEIGNLQALATREDVPLPDGIMTWNSVANRLDSVNTIVLPISFTSTENSTSATTGAIKIAGGVGIEKDMYINGEIYFVGSSNTSTSVIWTGATSNNLNLSSPKDINLIPSTGSLIKIPYNINLVFGSTTQSIIANSITDNLDISAKGDIKLNVPVGQSVIVGNQVPIEFSTPTERIYTDSGNNMAIEGSQDIELTPGVNKKVILPVNIPIAFSNINQAISANLLGDLSIAAGNNILLQPGATLDVRIPTDNRLKFGGSGSQRLWADSGNVLNITSSADINLSPTKGSSINIPEEVRIAFGNNTRYINSKTDGNLYIMSRSLVIESTESASSVTAGSIYTYGGIGVKKGIYSEGNIEIETESQNALVVKTNGGLVETLKVTNSSSGSVRIRAGNGGALEPTLELQNNSLLNACSMTTYKAQYDTSNGYAIGRGTSTLNSGRSFTVNIPSYSDYMNIGDRPRFSIMTNDCTTELFSVETDTGNIYALGTFSITGTEPAVSSTEAGFVLSGGLGIVKNIIGSGDWRTHVDNTGALLIQTQAEKDVFKVDTVNETIELDSKMEIYNTIGNVFRVNDNFVISATHITTSLPLEIHNTSGMALLVTGGTIIGGKLDMYNNINMNNSVIYNVTNPTDGNHVANKSYVDSVAQGLTAKDAVAVSTITDGNLSTDFENGDTVDSYVLVTGDRILIKDQINGIENGIYIVNSSGAPTRASDLPNGDNAAGITVFAINGTMNANIGFICNNPSGSDIVGTDSLNFTAFSGAGQITAGQGLSKTFNTLDVNVDDSSIEISSDILRIKNTISGTGLTGGSGVPLSTTHDQSHVTMLGTVNSGTWQANTVEVSYGGTGRTQFTTGSILYGSGTSGVDTNINLHFDETSNSLGIGTNVPGANIEIKSTGKSDLLLNADSDGVSSTSGARIIFANTGDVKGFVALTRQYNELASDVYPQAIVITNDELTTDSNIQFATQQQARMIIRYNGNVGINTSDPNARLDVNGSLKTSGVNTFLNTENSSNLTNGSVSIYGGVGIAKDTIIGQRLRVNSTEESINMSSGSIITDGGLTVRGTRNSVSITDGGSMTVFGGGSIAKDLYVGGSVSVSNINVSTSISASSISTGTISASGVIQNGGFDFVVGITDQTTRGDSGLSRALVKDLGSTLVLNYGDDFTGGIRLGNGTDVKASGSIKASNNSNTLGNIYTTGGNVGIGVIPEHTLHVNGTLKTNSTENSVGLGSGGSLTVLGGASVGKDLYVGGSINVKSTIGSDSATSGSVILSGGIGITENVNIGQELTVNGAFNFNNGGLYETNSNTNASALWYYYGKINDTSEGYLEVEYSNGIMQQNDPVYHGLKMVISIKDTSASVAHSNYSNVSYTDGSKITAYVYRDGGDFHLFSRVPAESTVHTRILGKLGSSRMNIVSEGLGSLPDGSTSGFSSWTLVKSTDSESTLDYRMGSVIADGITFKTGDNLPVVGINTTSSRDLGLLLERYQQNNDLGNGDVVNDSTGLELIDTLPSQMTASITQVIFSAAASAIDDYYNGYWVKVTSGANSGQIRKIVDYNGALRTATLQAEWTSSNPSSGDIVEIYNKSIVTGYFDENDTIYKFNYVTYDEQNKVINKHDGVDVQFRRALITSTQNSTSSSVGSLVTDGGIGVKSTLDATSSTNGGSITVAGGIGVKKSIYVGDGILVGTIGQTKLAEVDIRKQNSRIRLQAEEYNYVDFVGSTSSVGYGILHENDIFHLTYTNTSETPNLANGALCVVSNGNIGIQTTDVTSTMTFHSDSLIGINSTIGYLGLIGGNVTESSSIILNSGGSGKIEIASGDLSSVEINTGSISQMKLENGVITMYGTEPSLTCTTGSLRIYGGVSIQQTENSESITNGGSLTVSGGVGIKKDLYVGGDLFITGSLVATGSVTNPSITTSNLVNCTVNSINDVSLINVAQEAILTFGIEIVPTIGSVNCQLELELPDRTNAFVTRSEAIIQASGYTDDVNLIVLQNVLSVGIVGTTRILLKFQSVNTSSHYLNVFARYKLA